MSFKKPAVLKGLSRGGLQMRASSVPAVVVPQRGREEAGRKVPSMAASILAGRTHGHLMPGHTSLLEFILLSATAKSLLKVFFFFNHYFSSKGEKKNKIIRFPLLSFPERV